MEFEKSRELLIESTGAMPIVEIVKAFENTPDYRLIGVNATTDSLYVAPGAMKASEDRVVLELCIKELPMPEKSMVKVLADPSLAELPLHIGNNWGLFLPVVKVIVDHEAKENILVAARPFVSHDSL